MKTGALLFFLLLAAASGLAQSQNPSDAVAEVSADRGPCSAAFHVTDLSGNPLYNATIKTVVRWGLGHKVELQVGTNAAGRARFVKLPEQSKKPLQFEVSYQGQAVTFSIDPAQTCQAQREVPIKVSPSK